MTKMKNLGNLSATACDTPLAKSKMWERDIETISPAEIYAFIHRHKLIDNEEAARQSVDMLLFELKTCIARRQVSGSKIERLSAFDIKITLSDIRKLLNGMTRIKSLATIFALETGVDLSKLALLRWSQLDDMNLSERAKEVISNVARHIRTDLVFWEYESGRLSPLFSFGAYVESKTNTPWTALQIMYKSRIDIDFDADFEVEFPTMRRVISSL